MVCARLPDGTQHNSEFKILRCNTVLESWMHHAATDLAGLHDRRLLYSPTAADLLLLQPIRARSC